MERHNDSFHYFWLGGGTTEAHFCKNLFGLVYILCCTEQIMGLQTVILGCWVIVNCCYTVIHECLLNSGCLCNSVPLPIYICPVFTCKLFSSGSALSIMQCYRGSKEVQSAYYGNPITLRVNGTTHTMQIMSKVFKKHTMLCLLQGNRGW